MESPTVLISFLLLFLTVNLVAASTGPSPGPGTKYTPAESQEIVAAHNKYRAEVGAPSIAWNCTLASYAQSWCDQRAEDCEFRHSIGEYGENIAGGVGLTGKGAVDLWYEEKPKFDKEKNCCIGDKMSCRHYTQVVWKKSLCVGCGVSKCKSNGFNYITCSYNPPGNYEGESPF